MKKLLLAMITTAVLAGPAMADCPCDGTACAPETPHTTFAEKHPKVAKVWKKTRAFCVMVLPVAQTAVAAATILVLIL